MANAIEHNLCHGALSFDELLASAEDLGARLGPLASESPLPPEPDTERLDALCADIGWIVLRRNHR